MTKEACFDKFDFLGCEAADLFCQTELAEVPAGRLTALRLAPYFSLPAQDSIPTI